MGSFEPFGGSGIQRQNAHFEHSMTFGWGFEVLWLGFKVLELGCEVLELGFSVLGLGFEVLGHPAVTQILGENKGQSLVRQHRNSEAWVSKSEAWSLNCKA